MSQMISLRDEACYHEPLRALDSRSLQSLQAMLNQATQAQITPSVQLWVGASLQDGGGYRTERGLREGKLNFEKSAPSVSAETRYDLASLTKPLVTALWFGSLVSRAELDPQRPLGEIISCSDSILAATPVYRLLNHSSGLPSHVEYYRGLIGAYSMGAPVERRRSTVRRMIAATPLAYYPGERSVYSDLGYLMLEWVCERISGQTLGEFWESVCLSPPLRSPELRPHFRPLSGSQVSSTFDQGLYASTERCPWRGKVLQGEVHDDNAWILGGVCGHAGLFGTARTVGLLAEIWLRAWSGLPQPTSLSPEVARWMLSDQHLTPHQGSFVLGWDTPSAGYSTSGHHFSRHSIGHLGFTGTSLWVDLARQVVIVLLTHRVHPRRDDPQSIQGIRALRPQIHDEVWRLLATSLDSPIDPTQ